MTRADHAPYAELEVLATGPLALLQDAGRPGLADWGVSPSGAADRGAFALGARLLGHDPVRAGSSPAAIECLLGGLVLRARGSVTVAVTGAPAPATVDGRPQGHVAPFLLRDGQALRLARPSAGLRTYVSVRGGIAVPATLGSRSYDTLSGLGPRPLRAGDVLPIGVPAGEPSVDVAPVVPPPQGLVTLEVMQGPRWDWLADPAQLLGGTWRVAADSDRVGVRLEGPLVERVAGRAGAEVPSEGMLAGAVQLPPDGHPVVMLADHPVTGGYPVVVVLTAAGVDAAAQAVPGQPVALRLVSSARTGRRRYAGSAGQVPTHQE